MSKQHIMAAEDIRDRMLFLTGSIVNMLGGTEKARWTVFDADSIIYQDGLDSIEGLCGYVIQMFTPEDVFDFAYLIPAVKDGKCIILIKNGQNTETAVFECGEGDEHAEFVAIHEYVRTIESEVFMDAINKIIEKCGSMEAGDKIVVNEFGEDKDLTLYITKDEEFCMETGEYELVSISTEKDESWVDDTGDTHITDGSLFRELERIYHYREFRLY